MATIIVNARIHTQDAAHPAAHSVRFDNGLITGVDVEPAPGDKVIDAHGATVVPGFNDIHAHSVWFGRSLREIDLGDCASAKDVYGAIAAAGKAGEWIVASNYNPSLLSDAPLKLAELDRAAGGHPLLIKHNSGHAFTVNSLALQAAGVDPANPPSIEGGEVVTDDSGHVTGLLDENAMRLIQNVLQPESEADIVDALDRATSHYLSEGITSVTDAGVAGGWIGHSPQEFGFYQRAREEGKLRTRCQAMITLDALHDLEGHDDDPRAYGLDAGIRTGLGDEHLQLGPAKIFTDGSLIGRTAAMTQDYCCCPAGHRGYLQGDPEEMRRQALGAAAAGWSLAVHAIGDSAIDLAADIIAEATSRYGRRPVPHRIEHGGVVRDDQIDRLRDNNVVVVPQPRFITEFGDGMAEVLGPERTALSYPARRLLDAGLTLPGSSDRPVADGNPLRVIQAFATRQTPSGAVYGEGERISVAEALHAYTVGSAEATGWGGRKGRIAPGQLADMVALDADPLAVDVDELDKTSVLATIIGGELVFGEL